MHAYRTHNCSNLRLSDNGISVKLAGWVHRKRDHGELLFIDLRDHFGITQLVVDSKSPFFAAASKASNESVIIVEGQVVARTSETINKELPTGEVEVKLSAYRLESAAEPLPIQVNADKDENEEARLRYRFLDLRRDKLHKNIILRSAVISSLRRRMTDSGFMEFQTPILTASSPEGARDFLVPSRLNPGTFYALPQAPHTSWTNSGGF